jgi:hypothetical protein
VTLSGIYLTTARLISALERNGPLKEPGELTVQLKAASPGIVRKASVSTTEIFLNSEMSLFFELELAAVSLIRS